MTGCSCPRAIKYISEICGFDYYVTGQEKSKAPFLKWLNFVDNGSKEESNVDMQTIPETVLNQFVRLPVCKWIDEGISIESQAKFGIGVDIDSERIIIPIRDETGELIGIKARLMDDNKINDDKYIYFYNCPKSKLLYGFEENYENIKKANEVLVVEAEKSVLKLYSMGYKNAVAIGGKSISETQSEILQSLQVPICLALDEDVTDADIEYNITKLKYPIETTEIYVIRDKDKNILEPKESPCDNVEKFEKLYSHYKERV